MSAAHQIAVSNIPTLFIDISFKVRNLKRMFSPGGGRSDTGAEPRFPDRARRPDNHLTAATCASDHFWSMDGSTDPSMVAISPLLEIRIVRGMSPCQAASIS